jgi:CheY-like chemotaxis protein
VAETGPVLVIEDDATIAGIVAGVLGDEGYQVVVARDGVEALERIAAQAPRLILLDMRMPRVNGWEFAAAYRARTEVPAPIVVITAGRDASQKAREIGADAYIAKPFDIDDVVSLVARLVGAP